MSKKLARTIITNISDPNYNKNNILHHLSAQLSDGYWENEENFYFDTQNNKLIIKVKAKPTWPNVKDIFSDKSDVEIIHYIGEVLEDCYSLAPSVFRFDDIIVENTVNELKNYDCFIGLEEMLWVK